MKFFCIISSFLIGTLVANFQFDFGSICIFIDIFLDLVRSNNTREKEIYCFICNRDTNCVIKHVVTIVTRWSKMDRLLDQDVLTL